MTFGDVVAARLSPALGRADRVVLTALLVDPEWVVSKVPPGLSFVVVGHQYGSGAAVPMA